MYTFQRILSLLAVCKVCLHRFLCGMLGSCVDLRSDPLHWPRLKRHCAFGSICAFTFSTNFAFASVGPSLLQLVAFFGKTPTEVSQMTAWTVLALGLGNFLWVPLGGIFGKRPVFALTTILFCACMLWAALADSFTSLLSANVVSGLAGSAGEALAASIAADIYSTPRRGLATGTFFSSLLSGITLGPVVGGLITTAHSWRLLYWTNFGLIGLACILVLLLYSETQIDRSSIDGPIERSRLAVRSSKPTNSSKPGANCRAFSGTFDVEVACTSSSSSAHSNSFRLRMWLKERSVRPRLNDSENPLTLFLRPFSTFCYPSVFFAWLMFTIPMAWIVSMIVMNTLVLHPPPYNWTPRASSLLNIAGFLGCIAGTLGGSWLSDCYVAWRIRAKGGFFEPETRLHLVFIPAAFVASGCLAFGYGAGEHLHWAAM